MTQPSRVVPKPIRFINKQAKKCFQSDIDKAVEIFASELEDVIAYGIAPTISSDNLPGDTTELRKNGSPAFRCVYKVLPDCILVIHAFKKTCQGPDKKNLATVAKRLRDLDPTQFQDF